jgi:replication factor C large subunit
MTELEQPWTDRFRPRSLKELVDNERAISQLLQWIKLWNKGIPDKRSAFLFGPPGVGKTSSVVAAAKDLGFDLLEVNASDYRTRSRLEELIGRASAQRITVLGRRRMILIDELEGVSGRKDHGGISAIARIIKETRSPVILVATSVHEGWEENFRPLSRLSILIEYGPVPFADVVKRLRAISLEVEASVDDEVFELISERSKGDLRSAINDLESLARGRSNVSIQDAEHLSERDRKWYTPDALMRMFSATTLREARQIINSSYIHYDDLFDWIYENLPDVLDDPRDLDEGLDALALADIHQGRARRTQVYRLIKYMFNDMTAGVALSRRRSGATGLVNQIRTMFLRSGSSPRDFTLDQRRGLLDRPILPAPTAHMALQEDLA